jgi:hypothetical protein
MVCLFFLIFLSFGIPPLWNYFINLFDKANSLLRMNEFINTWFGITNDKNKLRNIDALISFIFIVVGFIFIILGVSITNESSNPLKITGVFILFIWLFGSVSIFGYSRYFNASPP